MSVNDDSFTHGGHSLLAMRAVAELNQSTCAGLSVADVLRAPTVARLARVIDERATRQRPPVCRSPRPGPAVAPGTPATRPGRPRTRPQRGRRLRHRRPPRHRRPRQGGDHTARAPRGTACPVHGHRHAVLGPTHRGATPLPRRAATPHPRSGRAPAPAGHAPLRPHARTVAPRGLPDAGPPHGHDPGAPHRGQRPPGRRIPPPASARSKRRRRPTPWRLRSVLPASRHARRTRRQPTRASWRAPGPGSTARRVRPGWAQTCRVGR
jgi:hypothetical protein